MKLLSGKEYRRLLKSESDNTELTLKLMYAEHLLKKQITYYDAQEWLFRKTTKELQRKVDKDLLDFYANLN
jgi:hypothetical protein